jgi:serine/threonine protein kinase
MLGAGSKLYFEKTGLVVTVDKEILGEGGFSTVFRASSEKEPSTKYALKKILVQTEEIGRSVMSEIRSLNLFRHPNIIKLTQSTVGITRTIELSIFCFLSCREAPYDMS